MSPLRAAGPTLTLLVVVLLAMATRASCLAAQQIDVVRGQVTGPDARPIENVTVTATAVGGGVSRSAATDRGGRFTIVFPGGQGDYFVSFVSMGYTPRRIQVRRTADQEILIADARMQRMTVLDTVTTTASRRRPDRSQSDDDLGVDASDPGMVSPEHAGDLYALAGTIPGITAILAYDGDASGFSAFGLAADQSSISLNGAPFAGQSLPRDAEMQLSVTTSPFDVSLGGFSGAHLRLRSVPPSRFTRRGTSTVYTTPALQWTDRSARALGQQHSNVSLGGTQAAPFQSERAFYSLSYQLGRRATPLRSLLNTDVTGLRAGGIAADSVARLLTLASSHGIPLGSTRVPGARHSDEASLLATLDVLPPTSSSGQSLGLIASGSWKRQNPASNLVGELPTRGGDRTSWSAGGQARHTAILRGILLAETTVSASGSASSGSAYAALPSGAVLVSSTFPDSSASLETVWFGGNAALESSNTSYDVSLANQLSWFSLNNRHRLKLTGELRYDGFRSEQTSDARGTFSYTSLSELAANRPAVFSRSLRPRVRAADQVVAALSLGDAYARSSNLQIQYGIRLDANRFMSAPTYNADVERDVGVRNDVTPSGIYLSPRVGFSYAYGSAPQIAGFAGAVQGPRAVVRGGIGVFQNVPRATLIAGALGNTGLPEAVEQVTCVGDAVPTPTWQRYGDGEQHIPTACLDGSRGSPFASSLPTVMSFAKRFTPPRSVRSNLSWSGPVVGNRLRAGLDLTYSLNVDQPSTVNVNFTPTVRFTLPAEEDRAVYVAPASIVPATGAVAATDARVSQRYAHVLEERSDLTSRSTQISVGLGPTGSRGTAGTWWLTYVYSDVREQYRGFTSTAGNPLATDWSVWAGPRHRLYYGLDVPLGPVRVSWSGQVAAGSRYTPEVAGDVNGDGYAFNDRAFVVDPSRTTDSTAAAAMRRLLSGASPTVRRCLSRQLGRLAARHSCEGPWSATGHLSLTLDPVTLRLPQRARVSASVSNPLGAADLLLHPDGKLRGWGQAPYADPTLLYVRGFDPASRRFRYEVNPRFGSTNPEFNRFRSPVTLTLHVRLDVGPSRERQQLRKQLNIGRREPGDRVPALVLQLMFGRGVVANPMMQMLRESDSLNLSGAQADSLATWNRRYVIQLDSIWAPVAQYWEALPDRYHDGEAHARYKAARRASIDLLIELAPLVNAALTAEQRRKLPPLLSRHLDRRYLESIRDGTPAGGASSGSLGGGSVPLSGG